LRRFLLPQRRNRLHPDHIGFRPRTPDDGSNDRSRFSFFGAQEGTLRSLLPHRMV
jgi:hypothetical protein